MVHITVLSPHSILGVAYLRSRSRQPWPAGPPGLPSSSSSPGPRTHCREPQCTIIYGKRLLVLHELINSWIVWQLVVLQTNRRMFFIKESQTNLGASSMTFWLRLWMEHSRSFSQTPSPCLSHSTCTSMWRGLSINFSINIRSSPKLDAASWDDNLRHNKM